MAAEHFSEGKAGRPWRPTGMVVTLGEGGPGLQAFCKHQASVAMSAFRLNTRPPPNLAPSLRFGGMRRYAYTHPRRLITRRSQIQILPPRLRKAPETAPFASHVWVSRCELLRELLPELLATGLGRG